MQRAGEIAVPENERGNKGGDDEVSIYLHVVVGRRRCDWFGIKTGSEISKEPVDPVFDSEPNKRLFSGYTVVGSTIYSIGGREEVPSSVFPVCSDECFPAVADVYYLDTLSPGVGWKKLAHPMNFPRHQPYAFTIKSKIYVMGGVLDCDILSPTPEVHDTEEEQGWRILGDSHKFVLVDGYNVGIDGHAVVDDGKRVIVVSCLSPHLFSYDVEGEHSCEIYAEGVLGFRKEKSAVVDGILYYLDPLEEGDMFGIELANPKKSKKVVLKSNPEYDWIPQPVRECEDYMYPPTFLVPVGEGKLAVLWTMRSFGTNEMTNAVTSLLHVYCSTIKMSKRENEGDHDYELEANPLSLSEIAIRGLFLTHCLPIFPSKTRGPRENVGKDAETISAQEDVCKEDMIIPTQANEQNSSINNNNNNKMKNKN